MKRLIFAVSLLFAISIAAIMVPAPASAQGEYSGPSPIVRQPVRDTRKPAPTALTGDTQARQAIMIDYDTGAVLFEKNPDEKMPTSSMSKTITAYTVFQALREGRIALDTLLPVSKKAWQEKGSRMFVEVGKKVPVELLIQGLVVQSGNDAAVVLAEGLAGTEDGFAGMLNQNAEMLGMKNSHFANANGLPLPDHYSTARDLATLAWHVIHDFPEYYHYFGEKDFTFNNIHQMNRNKLLFQNIGADGLKTGHTEIGGYGLLASGTRNNRRVILVLNGLPSDAARTQEGIRLLDWGLRSFENVTLVKKDGVAGTARVVLGKSRALPLVTKADVAVTLPTVVRNDLKVEIVYDGPLVAPVKKGTEVAKLHVTVPRGNDFEVPLYAGADVPSLGFLSGAIAKAKVLLGSNSQVTM
jgi:D-alanyl-D-alanine carboxypeptidase (penicillin-binding protein 5/6)